MIDYLIEFIADFGEECSTVVATPAGNHIFESNPDCPELTEATRKKIHRIVTKLLFVAMRARPDIQVPVSYLTSRVTVTHGDSHTYVGMDIHFKGNREVTIAMIDYLIECISDFGEVCSTVVATPAGNHIFESNPDCPKLTEAMRKKLHRIVAKLLFVEMRARPDIQVPVSYLTSRVTKADEDD